MTDNIKRLAESIWEKQVKAQGAYGFTGQDMINLLESLLREAMEEAKLEQQRECAGHCEAQRQEAYTRAAEVVRGYQNQTRYDDHSINGVLEKIAAAIEKLKEDK